MAITNHERVGKALELLREGLKPFVTRELEAKHGKYWVTAVTANWPRDLDWQEGGDEPNLDAAVLLRMMWDQWHTGLQPHPGLHRAQHRQRAARDAQQVGAPKRLLQRRRLPGARLRGAPAHRHLRFPGRRTRKDEAGAAAAALRRAGAQRKAQERRHGHREPGHGQPQALARGGDAPPRRGQRPLPAGRVRRGSVAGPPGRRDRRIPRPGGVFPPHLSHREPEGDAGGCSAPAHRPGRRPGRAVADQLRRRQDPLHAGDLSPLLRRRAERAGRHRRHHAGGGGHAAAEGAARGAGGQQDFARQSGRQSRRHGGAHALGRVGLAVGRQAGLRPHPGRRRAGHQPRRCAARAVQRVWPLPDPHRRVGGLRPPAPRPERPARRQLRDPVHLRPGADRIGQAGAELPAGDQPARLGHRRLAPHPGRRCGSGRPARARGAGPAAQRGGACGVLLAARQRRGRLRDRAPAPVRAARRSCPIQGPRRGGTRLRRPLPHAAAGVPARVPRRRLRAAHPGSLPDPPGDFRPALHRLVHAGEVPAHARRAAADGRGDPQPLGEGRPQPADPARQHRHRRPTRAVRADALPLRQLDAHHREGRGRAQLAAAAAGRRAAQPRQVCGLPARGAHHLPGVGAHRGGGPPRHRGSAGEARLRHAGRVAGGLR